MFCVFGPSRSLSTFVPLFLFLFLLLPGLVNTIRRNVTQQVLMQIAANSRSFSLYAKLGFEVKKGLGRCRLPRNAAVAHPKPFGTQITLASCGHFLG